MIYKTRKCDFCKREGQWEAMPFESKEGARKRSLGIAAVFPWNMRKLPPGVTFTPESLRRAGVMLRTACPDCFRD